MNNMQLKLSESQSSISLASYQNDCNKVLVLVCVYQADIWCTGQITKHTLRYSVPAHRNVWLNSALSAKLSDLCMIKLPTVHPLNWGKKMFLQKTFCIIHLHQLQQTKERRTGLCVWGHQALGIFVDTTCSVCCAWAMPVYVSPKVNSGGGKERHLAIHTGTKKNSLSLSLWHAGTLHGLTTSFLFTLFVLTDWQMCWTHSDPDSKSELSTCSRTSNYTYSLC